MSEQKLYDLTLVNQVAKGNAVFIKKLCAAFVTGSREAMAEMSHAIQANNWSEVSRLAHKVKSTIDTMNIVEAKVLIREIEALAIQQQSLEQVPVLLSRLQEMINAVSAQLNADFDLKLD